MRRFSTESMAMIRDGSGMSGSDISAASLPAVPRAKSSSDERQTRPSAAKLSKCRVGVS